MEDGVENRRLHRAEDVRIEATTRRNDIAREVRSALKSSAPRRSERAGEQWPADAAKPQARELPMRDATTPGDSDPAAGQWWTRQRSSRAGSGRFDPRSRSGRRRCCPFW